MSACILFKSSRFERLYVPRHVQSRGLQGPWNRILSKNAINDNIRCLHSHSRQQRAADCLRLTLWTCEVNPRMPQTSNNSMRGENRGGENPGSEMEWHEYWVYKIARVASLIRNQIDTSISVANLSGVSGLQESPWFALELSSLTCWGRVTFHATLPIA